MSTLKKLLALVAATTMWATIQPGTLSAQPVSWSPAQTSGIGGDAITRVLWKGTDGRIALWKLNPNITYNSSVGFGPYDGWIPIAITTAADNNTYVLWQRWDGLVTIWLVNANLQYVTQKTYGPYAGWFAESLSADTNGNSFCRILWRHTQGSISVWSLNQNLDYVTSQVYGPYFGYSPSKESVSDPANTKVAAAMDTKARQVLPFPGAK